MSVDHKSWITSHTECPGCQKEFNFRHSKLGSVSAVRYGPNWTFACPYCKTRQNFLLKKGEVDGLPIIMDQSLSPFLTGAFAGTATIIIAMIALYFAVSGNTDSTVFSYGFALSLLVYLVYMIYLGFIARSSGRSYIKNHSAK